MPLSNSVLRRYTPPTCTLEIRAKSSPLSRWVGQSVLKDLHFELRFDDPRKPEEKRVTIRGDRTDLEVLYDAVNSYVQNLLDPSPREFSVALHTPAPAKDSIPHENQSGDAIASPTSGIAPSESVAAQTPEKEPNQDLRNRPPSPPNLGGTGFTPPKVGGHRGPLEGLGGTGGLARWYLRKSYPECDKTTGTRYMRASNVRPHRANAREATITRS